MSSDSTARQTRLGIFIGYNINSGTTISMASNWEGNHVILLFNINYFYNRKETKQKAGARFMQHRPQSMQHKAGSRI